MLEEYNKQAKERQVAGLPPLPLTAGQTGELVRLLERGEEVEVLIQLLAERVEPGVSKAAKIKADWLLKVADGTVAVDGFSPEAAIGLLSRMGGGYNVEALITLLGIEETASLAAEGLKGLIKVYEAFDRIKELAAASPHARAVLESWARAEWFHCSPEIPETLELTIYKVEGEINTDDFSPGNQAQSRADIPLHATHFGTKRFPGGVEMIRDFRNSGKTVGFAGDVVGTGSSRKSAINSLVWHVGEDIPGVPNKRCGGVVIGSIIAPIFYATARDAGVLPIQADVGPLATGEQVTLNLKTWTMTRENGEQLELQPPPATLLDEYRAGGRLNLIIGRNLTRAACDALGLEYPEFQEVENPQPATGQGYTLAQKMVGRACGLEGVLPGTVCEPRITTVGSQDTTGPMTMQEIAELACLRFKADLFMQSFCHTAAYPKASDPVRWQIMKETTEGCGGVALKPGDGVIHSWLNRMLVPDTVGTGGDSHTRFPLGISFPAGSGLVAFAGALGFMPLEMPQSVLVRFSGTRQPGITVRDMVNAIPYQALKEGLLTVDKKGKKNIFAGTVLEIEGIDDLSVEEAFELSDASAERSAAASTLKLPLEAVIENVRENLELLKSMVADGYSDRDCLERRIAALEEWLAAPTLLEADDNAEYLAVLEIDLNELQEPLLACPNDPDDVRPLSEVAGTVIDEAFVGSCMVHIGHLRTASKLVAGKEYAKGQLWVAPPTRMARDTLLAEGSLSNFSQVGGRVEIPGCSLCMGNQARVRPGVTVMSTSTRNFDNRLGDNTRVFLGSTELTVYAALYGRLPSLTEYLQFVQQ